ncbi:MAG TPA: hypothetical protein VNO22_02845 [Planctomycetota bacterium]|nr:hypothetical protein [Planctomycetota bacterium]
METDRAENLFAAILSVGNLVVVLDESRWYASAHSMPQSLRRVLRIHRALGVDLYFTTQHVADAAQELWAVTDVLLVFRTLSPRARDYLRREFGVARDPVDLERGEFIELRMGLGI